MNPQHPRGSPISPHAPAPLPPIHTTAHRASGVYQLPLPVPTYTYASPNNQTGPTPTTSAYYSTNAYPPPQPHATAPPPTATSISGGLPSNSLPPPISSATTGSAGSAQTASVHDFGTASGPTMGGGMTSVLQPSVTYHTQYSASAPVSAPTNPQPSSVHAAAEPATQPQTASQNQSQQTPSPTLTSARRHTTHSIGKYITFASGPFSGRTIRAELVEVQKADLGRKCADPPTTNTNNYNSPGHGHSPSSSNGRDRDGPEGQNVGRDRREKDKEREETKSVRKDRRPLDPPPVVSLRYFERVGEPGREYEREIPAEDVEIGGLICQVDLFRVTIPPSEAEVKMLENQMRERVEGMERAPLRAGRDGYAPPGIGMGSEIVQHMSYPPQGTPYPQQWSSTPYDHHQPGYPYPPPPPPSHPHSNHPLPHGTHPHHPHLPPIDTHTHIQAQVDAQQSPISTSTSAGAAEARKRRRTIDNVPHQDMSQALSSIAGAGMPGGLLRDESGFRGRVVSFSDRDRRGDRDIVDDRERDRDRNERGRDREEIREREDAPAQSSPISPYAQTSYAHPHYGSSGSSSYPPPSASASTSYAPPSASTSSSAYPPSAYPSSASIVYPPAPSAYAGGVSQVGMSVGLPLPLTGSGPGAPINPDELPLPTEADKLTRCLFGEYYSHAANILDLKGKAVIYFVFSDLSVKLEGLFRPRYRFFDLFSRTETSEDVPVLAECFGGTFAVYSTKEFPGLKASTELTKHLNRWGIRVNIRETERKRRAGGASAPSGLGQGGRRGSEDDDGEGAGTSPSTVGPSHQIMDAPRRFLEGTAAQREKEKERSARQRAAAQEGATEGSSSRKKGKRRRSVAGGKT